MPLPATSAPLGTDPQITEDRSSGGRWAWPVMLVLTASAAVLAAMFPTRPTGRWVTVSLGITASLATAVAALPLARSRTIQTERRRIGLLAMATGILLLSAQEMLRALPDHRLPAYPLATDWLGLAAYPLLMLGLLLIMWMHVQERPLDSLLVAGMVPRRSVSSRGRSSPTASRSRARRSPATPSPRWRSCCSTGCSSQSPCASSC
jgi:hypothetical protein